jgi:accessory gene regulator B
MTIHNQASRLATGLVNNKIIEDMSHDVYTYGFELIISATVNILLIAIVSIVFKRYYDWLLFLAAFIPLRTTAGGYHASSHIRCIIVGTITFTVLLAISRMQINWTILILAIAVMSFLIILVFSPVEAPNKKLNEERRRKNRKVSIGIAIVNLLLIIPVFYVDGYSEAIGIYFAGVFTAMLSMLVVKTKNTRREGRT